MSQERRIHPRTETRIPATVRHGAASIEGVVENIGAGGVFFTTDDLEHVVEIEDAIEVVLQTAARGEIVHRGVIVRAERYFDGADVKRSFAVKFDTLLEPGTLGLGG